MSSFLSRPHPHNLSPVRMRALRAGLGGMAAGPAAPGARGAAGGWVRATVRHRGWGKDRRGSAPWERGSAAQGDCPESLGMLKKSRAKRNVLGAVVHLSGAGWLRVDKTHPCGANFQKYPQPRLFIDSCKPCLCGSGPGNGPGGPRAQTGQGQDGASPAPATHPVCHTSPRRRRRRKRSAPRHTGTAAHPSPASPGFSCLPLAAPGFWGCRALCDTLAGCWRGRQLA